MLILAAFLDFRKQGSLAKPTSYFCFWETNYLLYFFHYHSPPLYALPPPISPSSCITHCCPCPQALFWFCSIPLPPNPCPQQVSAWSLSLSPSLFCLLAQFVHEIAHMNEITWYFSFSNLLTSLSIRFSRFIHAVTKGKISPTSHWSEWYHQ